MVTVIDLNAEFDALTMLKGRTPTMKEADRKVGFKTLSPFRDGNIFSAKFSGEGAWERHPNGDELVQVLDGAATLHLMAEDGPQAIELRGGMIAIVPRNTWHRFHAPDGVSLITATPKPTEHLTVDIADPRSLDDTQRQGNSEQKWR